jgi:hypothetical protein
MKHTTFFKPLGVQRIRMLNVQGTITGRYPPTDVRNGQPFYDVSSKELLVRDGGEWRQDKPHNPTRSP